MENNDAYVYKYKLDTEMNKYVFSHKYECQVDPVGTEKYGKTMYLRPKDSTTIEPLIEDGKIAVWNGSSWEYEDDYKNKVYYNKNTTSLETNIKYSELNNYTTIKPEDSFRIFNDSGNKWEIDIEKLKSTLITFINNKLYSKENNKIEIEFNSPKRLYLFDSDEKSLTNISNLYNTVKDIDVEYKVMFRTYNNEMIELVVDELKYLLVAVTQDVQTKKILFWKIKDDFENISTFDELKEYYKNNIKNVGNYIKRDKNDVLEQVLNKIFK